MRITGWVDEVLTGPAQAHGPVGERSQPAIAVAAAPALLRV